ncbi:MAG: hypothetical protein IJL11_06500 [Synergistaceae bacterium]|nr:hypothetical protein [Synergistaceae bacterium]
MQKSLFENFIGKQVELFMAPNMPVASGILEACDDDFIVIGDEVWSYKAILGIRPARPTIHLGNIPAKEKEEAPQPSVTRKEKETETVKPQPKLQEKPKAPEASAPSSVPVTTEEEKPEANDNEKQTEIVIPNREFTGVLTEYFENRHWGFIESDEVIKAGIPLRDGKKVFVHLNQITDTDLRKKLMTDAPANPNVNVVFKLIRKQDGVAADDVRKDPNAKDNLQVAIADIIAHQADAEPLEETGEIDYYRRYENPPYGKIRIAGNKLFHFEDIDVIDPVLAVFLEVSPSAEGQAVKFIRKAGSRGRIRATNVEAATPFPDDKLESWKDLIEKAKKRMQQ